MIKIKLEDMTWQECKSALEETDLVIIPIGAVEQHGPHLPLGTDSMNIEYSAVKAAERCNVVVAPTIKTGISSNHMDFQGTITIKPETLINIIIDYCVSLSAHGFRKFILLNGHGGNNAAIDVSLISLQSKLPGHIFGHAYGGRLKKDAAYCLEDKIRYHADEDETSRMLVTAPHLVDMNLAVNEEPKSKSGLYGFQSSELHNQAAYYGLPRTKSCTGSGVFGNATIASAEKGKIIHSVIIDKLCEIIKKLKAVELEAFDE